MNALYTRFVVVHPVAGRVGTSSTRNQAFYMAEQWACGAPNSYADAGRSVRVEDLHAPDGIPAKWRMENGKPGLWCPA